MPGSRRGRTEVVYESDDSSGFYEVAPPPPPQRRRSRSRIGIRVIEDKYEAQPARQKVYATHSYGDAASAYGRDPENVVIHNHLGVPKAARPRAASTGGSPQPQFIPVYLPQQDRDRSRQREKWHKERRSSSSSDDSEYDRPRRRRRSKRRSEYLIAEQIAALKLEVNRKDGASDPTTADLRAKLEYFEKQKEQQEEREKEKAREKRYQELLDLATKGNKSEKKAEDSEAVLLAKIEEKRRKDKEERDRMRYELEEAHRKEQEAYEDALAKAEAKQAKALAKAKEERERIIAMEKQEAAKAAAEKKAETARILAERKAQEAEDAAERDRIIAQAKAKAAEKKAELERIVAEEKARAKKEKEEEEELRKRILFEEEERKKKKKAEDEELRVRILAEEKKREEEAKAKKKAEDDEFNQKVKERFMKAGYSPEYIEDILDEKKKEGRHGSTSHRAGNELALEMARPTYIRVKIKHLLPETLEHYRLPWAYDPKDENYILIKEYIDHDFQQVLFQHTKQIYKLRETRLIEGGWTKETVTTLKPEIYKDKDKDEMYLVRRKSQGKSPSRPGRKWMFT